MDPKFLLDEADLALAAFRYSVIVEVVVARKGEITATVRRAASVEHTAPDGQRLKLDERTIWRWLRDYRLGGLAALCSKDRSDCGTVRAIEPELLERAVALRREGKESKRATLTIIDILRRQHDPEAGEPLHIARSTLDRHFALRGVSRGKLHDLGGRPFTRIETHAPFELVVVDFHHGPYVRVGPHNDDLRRALLCAFIDHFSRYIVEGRYYLHEDFAALRFGFRQLLAAYGLPLKIYADNGASFQSRRFHLACSILGVRLAHSKPYAAESRGVIERLNSTVKYQFENEVRERDQPLTLDELNTYFQAWLSERYHRDIHSETGQAPLERLRDHAVVRPAAEPTLVDEALRLLQKRTVHRKWSTVQVQGIRYSVEPTLRRKKVGVLYDPFAPEYVLITYDKKVVQRALPQKAGEAFPDPKTDDSATAETTDYLALIHRDHERRTQAELAALRLAPAPQPSEVSLHDLVARLESCRGARLSQDEQNATASFWRKMRPIATEAADLAVRSAIRQLGERLHIGVYLDAINNHLIRLRTQQEKQKGKHT